MKVEVELEPFRTPNYVLAKKQPKEVGGYSSGGRIEELKWHLSEISAETLSELCDEFRAEIFKKAKKKKIRAQNNPRNHTNPQENLGSG